MQGLDAETEAAALELLDSETIALVGLQGMTYPAPICRNGGDRWLSTSSTPACR